MTKYSVSIWNDEHWKSIALFDDTCSIGAMIDFCVAQFMCGNSLDTPAENIAITDMETGEVVWDWESDQSESEDYFPDDVDESNYDPYMGCDFYDYGGEF